jgi:hypothetical protein
LNRCQIGQQNHQACEHAQQQATAPPVPVSSLSATPLPTPPATQHAGNPSACQSGQHAHCAHKHVTKEIQRHQLFNILKSTLHNWQFLMLLLLGVFTMSLHLHTMQVRWISCVLIARRYIGQLNRSDIALAGVTTCAVITARFSCRLSLHHQLSCANCWTVMIQTAVSSMTTSVNTMRLLHSHLLGFK